MATLPEEKQSNPISNPAHQLNSPPALDLPGVEGSPKFGRLLIILIITVFALGLLTWATEAFYS